MSEQEIDEYMKVYFELTIELPWKEGDPRYETPWYKEYLKTGNIDAKWLNHSQILKLKNKQYQLKKGNLDQSFMIWRLMKQKLDAIKIKSVDSLGVDWWVEQTELCRKGLPPYQAKP